MIEIILAAFVFLTIFIDTLSITIKAADLRDDFAKVYVVSQALTYVTRFSLFFILPLIGLILDKIISFNISTFLFILSLFMLFHSVIFYYKSENIIRNTTDFVNLFNVSFIKFFKYALCNLLFSRNINDSNIDNEKTNNLLKIKQLNIIYTISHFFLALIFPLVIYLGNAYEEYRGLFMGSTSVYSGVFSIYITFFVERRIPYMKHEDRSQYIYSLINSKVISTLVVSISVLVLLVLLY